MSVVVVPLATLSSVWETIFGPAVGSQADSLQAAARTLLVYGFAVLLVRLGNRRFLGRNSTIDILLSIVLGSVLSRGINGASPLLPTLAASAALVAAHWVLAALTYHFKSLGELIKGRARTLFEHDHPVREEMRGSHISEDDLHEALRNHGIDGTAKVAAARLERNGDISVIEKQTPENSGGAPAPPRIIEVRVEAGVQTVRVSLE